MGRLIVNTLPQCNSIAAFVADLEGKPATGLDASNFRLAAAIPGADGAALTITGVFASTLRGFYVLDLQTVAEAPHRKGLHIFDLIVDDGERQGQTLSSVVMT